MPTGTAANKIIAPGTDNLMESRPGSRDDLDLAIGRGLRQGRKNPSGGTNWSSSQPSLKSSPETDALPEESVLQYVEGTLPPQEHTAFERRLLQDPYMCEQVAILKSALSDPAPADSDHQKNKARYVFSFSAGVLRFLRGTDSPLPGAATLAESAAAPGPHRLSSSPSFDFTHDFGSTVSQLKLESVEADRLNLALCMTEHGRPLCGQVSLWRNGQSVEPAPLSLDPEGMARFHGLLPARYELVVLRSAAEVGRVVVDIRAERLL